MMIDVPLYTAFAAGLVSFLSPCVLPLVPGYLSFISGVSIEQMTDKVGSNAFFHTTKRPSILINSMLFVFGFSVVFVLFGASATWMGTFISSRMSLLTKLAGAVIIFFGVFKMGLIRPFILYKETRFQLKDRKYGFAGAFLIGASFAFGWTPCIGPVLAGILAYAGTLEKVNQGIILLLMYSMGLGIPFLLTAIGVNQFFRFFTRIKRYLGVIEIISGIIMVILGLLIFTNKLILIPGYLAFFNRFAW